MLAKKPEKTYTRKVNQVGNSLAVNIPKELADFLSISKGEELQIKCNEVKDGLKIKKINRIPEGVRPELLKAMNKAISKYDQALRNLKER